MDPSERAQRVAAVFDRVASSYDQVGVDFFVPVARLVCGALRPQPGERALDVGCGRGAVTVLLADAVGPDGSVTGFDLSAGMVEATTADLRARGYHGVELLVADATDPGLEPGSFDVLASSLVVFFLPDPERAVRAWLRLLRPGGRLSMSTFGTRSPVWEQVDALFRPYLPAPMLDARTSGEQGPFRSVETTSELVAGAGFADVQTVESPLAVHFDSVRRWHDWSWSIGQRAMWEFVPEAARGDLRDEAYALLGSVADPEGSVVLDQAIRITTGTRPAD